MASSTSEAESDEHCSPTTTPTASVKVIRCTEKGCECTFKKKGQLREHLKDTHHNLTVAKRYECATCKRSFNYRFHLKRHEKIHNGYKCEVCALTYKTWSDLRKHRALTHKTNGKRVKCEACRKRFETRDSMKEHLKTCASISKLTCAICKKQFSKKSNLNSHLKTVHNCERDYTCVNCNKEFLHAHNVVKHLAVCFAKTVEDEVDPCASQMSIKEAILAQLDRSGRNESEEYQFQCELCQKRMKHQRSLWRHKKHCPAKEIEKKAEPEESSSVSAMLGFDTSKFPIVRTNDGKGLDWEQSPVVKIVKSNQEEVESLANERSISSESDREEHSMRSKKRKESSTTEKGSDDIDLVLPKVTKFAESDTSVPMCEN